MKTKYEVHKPGSKVYAISTYFEEGSKDSYHYAIFPAIVDSININSDELTYWLKTPEGKDWGADVDSSNVSDSFNVLVNKLKKVWEKHSEWD